MSRSLSRSTLTLFALQLVTTAQALESSDTATETTPSNAEASPECLQHTGSRLPKEATDPCIQAPGEVHTREDIERTGAVTVGDALRRLSPSVRTGR